jgi:SAM-dependent methyltransferase
MAKQQVAKSKSQKAPYVTPRILTFKADPKLISTEIDPLGDVQNQGSQGLNTRRLRLLPREGLIKTSKVDHADWNFIPVLGFLQRKRFRLAVSLLPPKRLPRMLEIGYGSGVFMPELANHCEELYGIDIHEKGSEVLRSLSTFKVTASLLRSGVEAMPFPNAYFDAAVAISSLEFVDDLDSACREIKRVLKPGGYLIVVTPGHSFIADLGLKLLTGQSARKDFGNRRESLVQTLLNHFAVQQRVSFLPSVGVPVLHLYTAFSLLG